MLLEDGPGDGLPRGADNRTLYRKVSHLPPRSQVRMRSLLTRRRVVLLILGAVFAGLFTLWRDAITRNRSVADEPFHIGGNLYYVGHTGLASYLLTGPEGHVLIDGGFPEHGPLIARSIAELGFDVGDVKILLNSHAHSDHAGGLRYLQEVSGAELWVSEGDADVMAAGGRGDRAVGPARFLWHLGALRFDPPRVDRVFQDGTVVRLGPIELTANVTPGHTRGCTSWSFPVRDGERLLRAVSICSLTLFPFVPLEREAYPGINEDWRGSFRTLRELDADIFLASHTNWARLHRKRARQLAEGSGIAPFIDPEGYLDFIRRSEQVYLDRVEPET